MSTWVSCVPKNVGLPQVQEAAKSLLLNSSDCPTAALAIKCADALYSASSNCNIRVVGNPLIRKLYVFFDDLEIDQHSREHIWIIDLSLEGFFDCLSVIDSDSSLKEKLDYFVNETLSEIHFQSIEMGLGIKKSLILYPVSKSWAQKQQFRPSESLVQLALPPTIANLSRDLSLCMADFNISESPDKVGTLQVTFNMITDFSPDYFCFLSNSLISSHCREGTLNLLKNKPLLVSLPKGVFVQSSVISEQELAGCALLYPHLLAADLHVEGRLVAVFPNTSSFALCGSQNPYGVVFLSKLLVESSGGLSLSRDPIYLEVVEKEMYWKFYKPDCTRREFPVVGTRSELADLVDKVRQSELSGELRSLPLLYEAPQGCCAQCGRKRIIRDDDPLSVRTESELFRCSRCKKSFYCSRSCQKQHWKAHKPECVLDV